MGENDSIKKDTRKEIQRRGERPIGIVDRENDIFVFLHCIEINNSVVIQARAGTNRSIKRDTNHIGKIKWGRVVGGELKAATLIVDIGKTGYQNRRSFPFFCFSFLVLFN